MNKNNLPIIEKEKLAAAAKAAQQKVIAEKTASFFKRRRSSQSQHSIAQGLIADPRIKNAHSWFNDDIQDAVFEAFEKAIIAGSTYPECKREIAKAIIDDADQDALLFIIMHMAKFMASWSGGDK